MKETIRTVSVGPPSGPTPKLHGATATTLHNHKTNIAPGRATILESKSANKEVYGVASMTR